MGKKIIFATLTLICLFGIMAVLSIAAPTTENYFVSGIHANKLVGSNSSGTNSKLESAPINPAFIEYLNHKSLVQSTKQSNGFIEGYIPAPVEVGHLNKISAVKASTPAYYDLRTLNKVTSVKDQGNAGNCWSFATYGSLESYLMPGEKSDFSENNMKNLLSSAYPNGFDFSVNDGGDYLMSTAYLARWDGPVDERDEPYDPYSYLSSQKLPIKKHVQDVLFIPLRTNPQDNYQIKWAIQNYGAVATYMYILAPSDPLYNSYFNSKTNSFYYNGYSYPNHAVDIIGWDDNYNKNNFKIVPPGNGAFIVKNSWGTKWGDKGYFYISYYDSVLGSKSVGVDDMTTGIDNCNVVFTAENTNKYKNIYQYDSLGWTTSLGIGSASNTGACANVFTAKSNEVLTAVGFYATDSNCNYQIYTSIENADPVLAKSGTVPVAGYHTIPLETGIRLNAGQQFTVFLILTTPNYDYPIAIETPLSGYSSKATASAGESYFYDGNSWKDITSVYPDTNVCIKAFTNPAGNLPTADFSSNKLSGVAPLGVTFTSTTKGNPTSYYWVFEPSTNSDWNSHHAVTAQHTFKNPGVYTVSLTVTNAAGSTTVTKQNYITVTAPLKKPISAFTADRTSGKKPLTTTFTYIATSGTPDSYLWNFGDKTTSINALTATHTYTKAGTYTVSLTVKNKAGSSTSTKTKYITVK